MNSNYREQWVTAGGSVPEHWEFLSIEDLLVTPKSITVGVMYPRTDTADGVPLVRVADVKDGAISSCPDFRISDKVNQEYKRTQLDGNELLITLVGNPGDCVVVTKEMKGWNVARALAVLRLKDPELRAWLRYVLLSKPAKHLIDARLNTTVQKTLNLKDIKELPVPIPPVDERTPIVDVASNIESKILVNRETNQTLEQIAQAIFKSWFVDFDPVRAKIAAREAFIQQHPEVTAEAIRAAAGTEGDTLAHAGAKACELAAICAISGKSEEQLNELDADTLQQLRTTAALFPDVLEESELGEVPEGWKVKKVDELVKRLTPKKRYTKKQVEPYGAVPVFEQGADILLGYHNEEPGFLATPTEPLFIFGDHTCVMHLSCEPFDISQNVIPLSGDEHPTLWVYYAVGGKQEFQEYRRHWSEFIIKDVVTPTLILSVRYAELVTELYKQKESSVLESNVLGQVRDAMLPKLLSGKLQVDDVA